MTAKTSKLALTAVALAWPVAAIPENLTTTVVNTYGTPSGLIDMPTAEMAPDGQLNTTFSYFDGSSKTTLSFQILPRLTGSFRLAATENLDPNFTTYYDRSFDLRFRLLNEGKYNPAIAVGLQDFVGTSLLGAEYIVATKSIGEKLRVTGGIGWGRLGSYNSFGSYGTRPGFDIRSEGGEFSIDDWFRGDYSFFGGASYDFNDRLSFGVEYSSDAYDQEKAAGIFERKTPWNFGLNYKVRDDFHVSAFYLHGTEIGAKLNFTLNPRNAPAPGGVETAPVPLDVRSGPSAVELGWSNDPDNIQVVTTSVQKGLSTDNIDLDGISVTDTVAHVRIRNQQYNAGSQALGRTLRNMSRRVPDTVETFRVTLMEEGIPVNTLTFKRSDLERLEHAPASAALAVADFQDPLRFSDLPPALDGLYPQFNWWIEPYLQTVFFDVENPVLADAGVRARAEYRFGSGFVAAGSVSVPAFGNLDDVRTINDSVLPRVRTSQAQYLQNRDPRIDKLTLAKYFRPAPDLYGRVTLGYLETVYAGVSGELLWKPVDSRLALGVEANYLEPRDFDQGLGLRSRVTPSGVIPRASGHVSAYYDLGNGFHTQLDVGRYLAGDWGATFSLDREFANGWKVGAFATKTNISSTEFGNGSFDKGIRFEIPLAWAIGKPTKKTTDMTLRPFQRDGGARVNVDGRLYDVIRDSHQPEIAKSWGKFWK